MAGEASHLSEGGVAPQDDLVLGVAVSADDFISVVRPSQVTHLVEQAGRGGEGGREAQMTITKHTDGNVHTPEIHCLSTVEAAQ